jgi:hypothetical protein
MLLEQDIQKIWHQLSGGDPIKIAFDGSEVMIRFLDHASKLSLTTSVYYGGNYIPASVRRGLTYKPPFTYHSFVPTFFTIDEENFQIYLNYLGQAENLTKGNFKELLEEFGWLAEKWRLYLDEHDKNDLVYVRVK